jgi:hypothetical protein
VVGKPKESELRLVYGRETSEDAFGGSKYRSAIELVKLGETAGVAATLVTGGLPCFIKNFANIFQEQFRFGYQILFSK